MTAILFMYNKANCLKHKQVLQQEAYPTIRPPIDAKKFGHPCGYPWVNGKRPVRDVAEPPCKISRQSVKPWLKNPLLYKKERYSKLSMPPIQWHGGITNQATYETYAILNDKNKSVISCVCMHE